MVLVDTSVWVDYLRGRDTAEAEWLAGAIAGEETLCICGLVLTEILQGVRTPSQHRRVKACLVSLLYLPTVRETYCLAADIYRRARRRQKAIRSTIDCIIAACAIDHDVPVLHRDRDYGAIAAVSKLKTVAV